MNISTEKIIKTLIEKTARNFSIQIHHMTGELRNSNYVRPRHLAMHALFRSGFSQADIANAFQKDHVTVSHAVRSIEHQMTNSAIVRGQVRQVSALLDSICEKQFGQRQAGVANTSELEGIDERIKRLEARVSRLETQLRIG